MYQTFPQGFLLGYLEVVVEVSTHKKVLVPE